MDLWSLAILPPCSIVRIVHTRSLRNRQLNFNLTLLLHSLHIFKKMVLKETNNEPQICKFGSNNCASCYEQIKHSFIFLGGVCCHEKFVMLSWTDYILTLFMPYCKYCKSNTRVYHKRSSQHSNFCISWLPSYLVCFTLWHRQMCFYCLLIFVAI